MRNAKRESTTSYVWKLDLLGHGSYVPRSMIRSIALRPSALVLPNLHNMKYGLTIQIEYYYTSQIDFKIIFLSGIVAIVKIRKRRVCV